MRRMEERVGMLRGEVEGRGYLWDGGAGVGREEHGEGGGREGVERVDGRAGAGERLGDEELARMLRERMEEEGEGDGVHL